MLALRVAPRTPHAVGDGDDFLVFAAPAHFNVALEQGAALYDAYCGR